MPRVGYDPDRFFTAQRNAPKDMQGRLCVGKRPSKPIEADLGAAVKDSTDDLDACKGTGRCAERDCMGFAGGRIDDRLGTGAARVFRILCQHLPAFCLGIKDNPTHRPGRHRSLASKGEVVLELIGRVARSPITQRTYCRSGRSSKDRRQHEHHDQFDQCEPAAR